MDEADRRSLPPRGCILDNQQVNQYIINKTILAHDSFCDENKAGDEPESVRRGPSEGHAGKVAMMAPCLS